jgi:hypothetical protein
MTATVVWCHRELLKTHVTWSLYTVVWCQRACVVYHRSMCGQKESTSTVSLRGTCVGTCLPSCCLAMLWGNLSQYTSPSVMLSLSFRLWLSIMLNSLIYYMGCEKCIKWKFCFWFYLWSSGSCNSLVSIGTGNGLDSPGLIHGRKFFIISAASGLALGHILSSVQWVLGALSPGVKQ